MVDAEADAIGAALTAVVITSLVFTVVVKCVTLHSNEQSVAADDATAEAIPPTLAVEAATAQALRNPRVATLET